METRPRQVGRLAVGALLAALVLLVASPASAQQPLPDVEEMTPEQAAAAAAAERERLAREQLQQAKLSFQRGEFGTAATLFEGALDKRPIALRSADELHDGFLHYAFTLFLQGQNLLLAQEKLNVALQLKPQYAPSPVTTRPDLLEFYETQQQLFLAQGGIMRLPTELFPELDPGARKVRREAPIPIWGIRLRQLGRPALGDALMTMEITGAAINLAGWAAFFAVYNDLRPTGDAWRTAFKISNPISFGMFWGAFATEIVLTIVFNRRAKLGILADARPFRFHPQGDALRREARDRHARRRAGLRLDPGAGFVLRAW